jgi:hypothetical protein
MPSAALIAPSAVSWGENLYAATAASAYAARCRSRSAAAATARSWASREASVACSAS